MSAIKGKDRKLMAGLIKKALMISIVGFLSFPVLYIVLMFATGQMRIEKGPKKPDDRAKVEVLKYSPIQDSLAAIHSKTFEGLVAQQKRLEAKQRQLAKREERILLLDKQLAEKEKAIEETREKIEEIVKNSQVLENKRIRALAKIYSSMRAGEAAPILESLPEHLSVAIMRAIGEDRQKAKILEKMDREKAGRISKAMGAPILDKKGKQE